MGHRGGNLGGSHDILGESLGGFELRGGLGRAEDRDLRGDQGIGDARGQWRFGSDNHQVAAQFLGQRDDCCRVLRVDCVGGDVLCDTGVAGGAMNFVDVGVCTQCTDNCMFTAAWANNQYRHAVEFTGESMGQPRL